MSMDPMQAPPGAPPPAAPEDDGPDGATVFAAACAALELAAGSPDAITAAADAEEFSVTFDADGNAVVSVGDVEVNVAADQIEAHLGEELPELAEIEDGGMPE